MPARSFPANLRRTNSSRKSEDFSLIYKGFLKDHYVIKRSSQRWKDTATQAVWRFCRVDVRVAAEDAQLAVSEVQRGLFPMSASTIRLPRQIPYTVAMDMLMSAIRSPDAAPTRLGW